MGVSLEEAISTARLNGSNSSIRSHSFSSGSGWLMKDLFPKKFEVFLSDCQDRNPTPLEILRSVEIHAAYRRFAEFH